MVTYANLEATAGAGAQNILICVFVSLSSDNRFARGLSAFWYLAYRSLSERDFRYQVSFIMIRSFSLNQTHALAEISVLKTR